MKIRLKELRKEKHITQIKLCHLTSISQSTISKLEQGTQTPNGEVIELLSGFFGVSTDYFLGISNYKYSPEFITSLNENAQRYNSIINDFARLTEQEQVDIYALILHNLYKNHSVNSFD